MEIVTELSPISYLDYCLNNIKDILNVEPILRKDRELLSRVDIKTRQSILVLFIK